MGNLLQGKTLGIIGLGTIGKELIKLVQGFNFHILAYDINHDHNFAREHQITYCDIENLLSKSDIISMPDAKGLIYVFHDLIKNEELGSYYYKGENITFNTPHELEVAKEELINFYTVKEEEYE